jgi:hypothetical protein
MGCLLCTTHPAGAAGRAALVAAACFMPAPVPAGFIERWVGARGKKGPSGVAGMLDRTQLLPLGLGWVACAGGSSACSALGCSSRGAGRPRDAWVCAVVVTALCLCQLVPSASHAVHGTCGPSAPWFCLSGLCYCAGYTEGGLLSPCQGPGKHTTRWPACWWGLCCNPGCRQKARAPGCGFQSHTRPTTAIPCCRSRRLTTCLPDRNWVVCCRTFVCSRLHVGPAAPPVASVVCSSVPDALSQLWAAIACQGAGCGL